LKTNELQALTRFTPASIRRWLEFGWKAFTEASFISIAYASIFCIVGAAAAIWLVGSGRYLLFIALAGGFMLVAPVLVTGYYQVVQLLREGKKPVFDDIIASFRANPKGILAIGAFVSLIYLIWIADAVMIYGMAVEKIAKTSAESSEGTGLAAFLLLGGGIGALLAFIIYAATAFSLPDAFYRKSGFGQAMVLSVKGVLHNVDVMLLWAVVLTLLTFGVLLVALPLIIVLFPILGYASYAAYLDLIGELPSDSE